MTKKRMFSLSKELEEGMSQTINTAKNNVGQLRYEVIPLSRIILDPHNPRNLTIKNTDLKQPLLETDPNYHRKKEELESLTSLSESIKKVGVRHAIEVYKKDSDYRLISGERRVLASNLAGKNEIQARILEHKPSALDLKLLQWIENIEREDLSTYERIKNVKQLITAYEKEKQETISAKSLSQLLGCTRQHATKLLTVVSAQQEIIEALAANKIASIEKVAFLAKVENQEIREQLINEATKGKSLEELKKIASVLQQTNCKVNRRKNHGGRPRTRINMGATTNVRIIKTLIESVLRTKEYTIYSKQFDKINWAKLSDVKSAFRQLLAIMEGHEQLQS